jgi:hypothetical protein
MKSVCLSAVCFFFVFSSYLQKKYTPLSSLVTMDIERDSNDNDAVEGKLNVSNHEDDDDNIQYGYRRSWQRTSYEYRGSSLLTPAQIMEQET